MAKPILVANWKNHPESAEAAASILAGFSKKAALYKKLSFYVAPPLTYFESASKKIKSFAGLATQDIFFSADGTHTGSVTPDIMKSFGVKVAIVGHSERRALGETNEIVAKKVQVALRAGIVPLLCIGEPERDEDGNHLEFVRDQLKFSLDGMRRRDDAEKLLIAYEPVWAVGAKAKGVITPKELAEMVIFIRKNLADVFGREAAEKVRILYGGSVDVNNAAALMKEGGVKGLLVGRASLDPKAMAKIAEALISR